MASAAKFLLRERSGIRLKPVLVADPATSAKALEAGNADLAVTRTDLGQPLNGKAIVIMRKSAAIIITPPKSTITNVAGLSGKRIGIVTNEGFSFDDRRLLRTILNQYNVEPQAVEFVPVEVAQISSALSARTIDAVFTIGVPTSGSAADIVSLVADAVDDEGEPNLLSISQSYAIALSSPAISATKIVAGAFGGAKPRPSKSIDSIAVTSLVMANAKLDDTVVSAITRSLFALKPKIAATNPEALRMEAPSTSKDAAISVHPGAVAFLDGEDLSLMMRYGDFIYLGAMVLSMIASAIAAVLSRASSSNRRQIDEVLARLMELLAQTRMAESESTLKLAELEIDNIVVSVLTNGNGKALDADTVSILGMAISHVREAMRDKHAELNRKIPASDANIRIAS